ncbi:hypothetical protein EON82_17870 [bacterium]|nr:MAG: hypothetical protein EON82_17870 [bacterium]
MKNGPAIPGWAAGVGIAAFVVILIIVGAKYVSGGGPLPESQYPKEAFQAPGYQGGRPSNAPPLMRDGKPVSGGRAENSAPGSAAPATVDPNNPSSRYGGYPGGTRG